MGIFDMDLIFSPKHNPNSTLYPLQAKVLLETVIKYFT